MNLNPNKNPQRVSSSDWTHSPAWTHQSIIKEVCPEQKDSLGERTGSLPMERCPGSLWVLLPEGWSQISVWLTLSSSYFLRWPLRRRPNGRVRCLLWVPGQSDG
jgi:hypothetical protein